MLKQSSNWTTAVAQQAAEKLIFLPAANPSG
jgi:hypothetical protein